MHAFKCVVVQNSLVCAPGFEPDFEWERKKSKGYRNAMKKGPVSSSVGQGTSKGKVSGWTPAGRIYCAWKKKPWYNEIILELAYHDFCFVRHNFQSCVIVWPYGYSVRLKTAGHKKHQVHTVHIVQKWSTFHRTVCFVKCITRVTLYNVCLFFLSSNPPKGGCRARIRECNGNTHHPAILCSGLLWNKILTIWLCERYYLAG